jgi:chromosome partitioning protein
MTVIISVMGRKGGIGKSTIAKNLAAGAARAGLRTILVDADTQHNAYDGLGIDTPAYDGLRTLVQDDTAEWADLLLSVPASFTGMDCPAFHVLPTADGQIAIDEDPATPTRLYNRFQELTGYIDMVIVDTSPGITQVHAGLYYASTAVLLPALCDIDSALSPEKTIAYLEAARRAGEFAGYPPARILGIVPNALDPSELVQSVNSGFIKGRYHERYRVFEPLAKKTVWRQAAQLRKSMYALADDGEYAERKAARAALREFQPVMDAVLALAQEQAVL